MSFFVLQSAKIGVYAITADMNNVMGKAKKTL